LIDRRKDRSAVFTIIITECQNAALTSGIPYTWWAQLASSEK